MIRHTSFSFLGGTTPVPPQIYPTHFSLFSLIYNRNHSQKTRFNSVLFLSKIYALMIRLYGSKMPEKYKRSVDNLCAGCYFCAKCDKMYLSRILPWAKMAERKIGILRTEKL
jgi:hypothetical protein